MAKNTQSQIWNDAYKNNFKIYGNVRIIKSNLPESKKDFSEYENLKTLESQIEFLGNELEKEELNTQY